MFCQFVSLTVFASVLAVTYAHPPAGGGPRARRHPVMCAGQRPDGTAWTNATACTATQECKALSPQKAARVNQRLAEENVPVDGTVTSICMRAWHPTFCGGVHANGSTWLDPSHCKPDQECKTLDPNMPRVVHLNSLVTDGTITQVCHHIHPPKHVCEATHHGHAGVIINTCPPNFVCTDAPTPATVPGTEYVAIKNCKHKPCNVDGDCFNSSCRHYTWEEYQAALAVEHTAEATPHKMRAIRKMERHNNTCAPTCQDKMWKHSFNVTDSQGVLLWQQIPRLDGSPTPQHKGSKHHTRCKDEPDMESAPLLCNVATTFHLPASPGVTDIIDYHANMCLPEPLAAMAASNASLLHDQFCTKQHCARGGENKDNGLGGKTLNTGKQ